MRPHTAGVQAVPVVVAIGPNNKSDRVAAPDTAWRGSGSEAVGRRACYGVGAISQACDRMSRGLARLGEGTVRYISCVVVAIVVLLNRTLIGQLGGISSIVPISRLEHR